MEDISREIEDNLEKLIKTLKYINWSDIPISVRYKTGSIFTDDLAAIIAANNEKELQLFIEKLREFSGIGESTVFNKNNYKLDRYSAALANGSSGDWCELDGGYLPALCHAGLYCLPSVLAEGEARGSTVEEMLLAFFCGYEVVARVARTFSYQKLVLHSHGSLAAIGSAASVAFLRKFSIEEILDAICNSATIVTPGPFNHAVQGGLIRNIWPGLGASNGIRAADLVQLGITGTRQSLYEVYVEAFGAIAYPLELSKDLKLNWAVMDSYHKIHACCQYSHSAIEATQNLLARITPKLNYSDIKSIRLETHWRGELLTNKAPKTSLAAKFSMEYILATTIYHGVADANAFHADLLGNQALSNLWEKVVITSYKPEPIWPNDRPARVTFELTNGILITEQCLNAKGGPGSPLSQTEINVKIGNILNGEYSHIQRIMTGVISLDDNIIKSKWSDLIGTEENS